MSYWEEKYNKLIEEYRRIQDEIRKGERGGDDSYLSFLDKKRNEIHNELRGVAPLVGKDARSITLDILESEGNAGEYSLPEFQIMNTNNTFDKITWIKINKDGKSEKIFSKYGTFSEYDADNSIPENLKAFIPFGQQEYWHLSDDEGFLARSPYELELRRRAKRVAELIPGQVSLIEIYSHETFHRGTVLFGVACSPSIVEKLLNKMSDIKHEISVGKEYFNSEQIREDARTIAKEDINYILSAEPGRCESRRYLIERYIDSAPIWFPDFKNDLQILFVKAREEADRLDKNKEIEEEMKGFDRAFERYPKETSMSEQESMKTRHRK